MPPKAVGRHTPTQQERERRRFEVEVRFNTRSPASSPQEQAQASGGESWTGAGSEGANRAGAEVGAPAATGWATYRRHSVTRTALAGLNKFRVGSGSAGARDWYNLRGRRGLAYRAEAPSLRAVTGWATYCKS